MSYHRSGLENHVTCSICMDLYDDPIALPCMHSFCRRCLVGFHSSNLELKCPDCRKSIRLDRGGFDNLPRNFQLGCIVDSYKREHEVTVSKFPVCSEHRSTCQLLCGTCKLPVCVQCFQGGHHVNHDVKITTVDKPDADTQLCGKHSRKLTSYCKDCKTMICLECLLSTHRDHCIQTIEEACLKTSQILEGSLTDLEARRCLLKATQKSCRTMAQKLQIDSQKKSQELSVYFNHIRESLDRKEASMLRELESREKSAVGAYLTKVDQASKKESKLVVMINDVKRKLTTDTCNLLQVHTDTTKRIEELLDTEENDAMPRIQGLDFVTLQTGCLEEYIANIKWKWPTPELESFSSDSKPSRPAPPIPAKRKTKSNPSSQSSISKLELKHGSPVKRGAQWKDGMKDGGPGHYGTVVQTTVDPNVFLVRWPNGNTGEYKYIPNLREEISPP